MQMLYLVSFETGFKLCDYFLDKELKIVLFYSLLKARSYVPLVTLITTRFSLVKLSVDS